MKAVLFDRDGTLIVNVPYNGDPRLVQPMDAAGRAVARARGAGLATGVVSNQPGVARDLLTPGQVHAVNQRVDELLGPFDVWQVCPHAREDHCACRMPAPGMILNACRALGIEPSEAAVIGDAGVDLLAAKAAGARAVLVPTPLTRPEEVDAADAVADDIWHAVGLLLGAFA